MHSFQIRAAAPLPLGAGQLFAGLFPVIVALAAVQTASLINLFSNGAPLPAISSPVRSGADEAAAPSCVGCHFETPGEGEEAGKVAEFAHKR